MNKNLDITFLKVKEKLDELTQLLSNYNSLQQKIEIQNRSSDDPDLAKESFLSRVNLSLSGLV